MREHYLINKEKNYLYPRKDFTCYGRKAFFTAKEREQLFALYKRLLQLSGDTLQKGDCHKLKIHLIKAVAEGNLPRNCFGMNPIIKDMQTAVIVAEEIGMKRASILGIMLHESVKNHLCTLASVQQEYGEDVAGIIRGLVKINELYSKSPTIESENFRNLLLSFCRRHACYSDHHCRPREPDETDKGDSQYRSTHPSSQ